METMGRARNVVRCSNIEGQRRPPAGGIEDEKPGDLPVQQATKFDFVINIRTARSLGIAVPFPLHGRADEVDDPRLDRRD